MFIWFNINAYTIQICVYLFNSIHHTMFHLFYKASIDNNNIHIHIHIHTDIALDIGIILCKFIIVYFVWLKCKISIRHKQSCQGDLSLSPFHLLNLLILIFLLYLYLLDYSLFLFSSICLYTNLFILKNLNNYK